MPLKKHGGIEMNEAIKIIIYYGALFTPYRILAYFPFYKRLRLPLASSVIIFLCCNIIQYSLMALAVLNGINIRAVEFISSLLCIIMYFSLINENPFKLLFFYIFTMDMVIVIRGITVFLQYTFFDISYTTEIILHTICFICFLPFILIMFKKITTIIFEVDAPKLWHTIWILPFVTTAIVLIFTYNLNPVGIYGKQFILARLLLIIVTILIYGSLLHALLSIKEHIILKEKTSSADKLITMYINQYNMLQSHITEIRKARHDLRQHINLIQTYIDKNDSKALSEYLALYKTTMPKDIKTGYCANYAVDAVLGWYGQIAEENNIEFTTDVRLPQKLNIPEPTLCVLFGNLLENSIEACKNTKIKKPFIKVHSIIIGDNALSLTIDNTCENAPLYKDGALMSTKHKGKGCGTYSVREIAARYNGIADFSFKDNVFFASVILYLDCN